MDEFRPPWEPGPAEILQFPHRAVRAWIVSPIMGDCNKWMAQLVGAPVIGPTRTEVAHFSQIEMMVKGPNVRRGLPIYFRDRPDLRARRKP